MPCFPPAAGTLLATGTSGGQAVPDLAASLCESLNNLRDRLSSLVTPVEVAQIEKDIEATLTKWGEDAAQSSLNNLNHVRQVMMAVATSAAAIADRDHRYTHRFKQLTERLRSAARVHDIETMRRSVIDSASEMKTSRWSSSTSQNRPSCTSTRWFCDTRSQSLTANPPAR